jgi:signal transduction histidine kinase/ActR/RegA family two-component response regulator|tara:strand:+ start:9374 stop:12733 length:3360 start_codon:yes stop_codon:yes gene_type:complete
MTARKKQGVFGARRKYNQWVANETLEDYALRFTSINARKWSALRVASTALGAITFLALEAIGGSITLSYGFSNALVSILLVSVIILLLSLPISYYSSKYGLDIDLLTRGAGFGYIGSTITSLIYASFTFIFLALEASIMALALELAFGMPLHWGYLVSTLIVIPIVTHGITTINRFQLWTQPLWVVLQLLPIAFVLIHNIASVDNWVQFQGIEQIEQTDQGLDWLMIGAASTLLFSLVAQIGEQADFARFIPPEKTAGKAAWWFSTILAGPGWIIIGAAKLLLGSFLLVLALDYGISPEHAVEPTQMYLVAFNFVSQSPSTVLALTITFVILSQLKINATNVYAGSIAWSNFFSRLTHAHPGRVVWVVFNVVVAIILMEIGIYSALEKTLGLFGIIAISWIGSIVADLVINKPLGLSPPQIEFKRAHLYDINPVGVGAMLVSMSVGIIAYSGSLGIAAESFASFITMALTFIVSPLIAWATKGRYYIARPAYIETDLSNKDCGVCENRFDIQDMTHCPLYELPICSLCCSLDARCEDACRPQGKISNQFLALCQFFYKGITLQHIQSRGFKFVLLLSVNMLVFSVAIMVAYLKTIGLYPEQAALIQTFSWTLSAVAMIVLIVTTWSFLLGMEGRQLAQGESQRQTQLLIAEIDAHQKTDRELQQAREKADAANIAKSRYLERISHELRTPLNSVMGYAQLLEGADDIPLARRESIKVMRNSSEHLTDLIEGLVDISKIEAGRLDLHRNEVDIVAMIEQLIYMFQIQAQSKNIKLNFTHQQKLPEHVIADGKRLRQVLINLISNAIKFTPKGSVSVDLKYRNQVAYITVTDSGVGIEESDISRISEAFVRISNPMHQASGSGLGLAITQALIHRMGGNLDIQSRIGEGSEFKVSLMLPSISEVTRQPIAADRVIGYHGDTLSLMVVDDDPNQRRLLIDTLTPLGFNVIAAADGTSCLKMLDQCSPKLFMLDISMPDMNGWELVAELRERGVNAPLVMISAEADEGFGLDTDKPLHNDYLVKPINMPSLLSTLAYHLNIDLKLADAVPETSASPTTNDPVAINELLSFLDIGYVDGFKKSLAKAKENSRLSPDLCTNLHNDLAQLQLTTIRSQLMAAIDEN